MLQGQREVLNELQQTNDSLLSNKTNESMRTLTVMNFVIMPLTLIAGIFGMNATFMFIHDLGDFFTIVACMLIIGILMFIYFRKKRWI